MKKEQLLALAKLLLIPALAVLLGVILLFNPDSATILAAKLVGWLLVICGAGYGISKIPGGGAGNWILTAVFVALGVVILKDPLVLAESIGRFLGIILMIRGLSDLKESNFPQARTLAIVTAAVGAVLVLLPMTLTRTILRLCGIVVAVLGAVNIAEKLRERKLLSKGDSNIIDAEP